MDQLFNDSVGHVKRLPTSSPRIIKTHLPPSHLPPSLLEKAKVVWVCRNPRDSLVSWYHHEKLLPVHGLKPDCLDEYVPFYIQDNALYGDYWTHLKAGFGITTFKLKAF